MICPGDNTTAAFIEGSLSGDELAHLEAHLAECARCTGVIAAAAREHEPEAKATPGDDGVGRYEIERVLGWGAGGVVFRALDRTLRRRVALKLMHVRGPDEERRLVAEARIMARLSHPHVVDVYDAGTMHGQWFLAMQFVDGTDAARWLANEDRSWRDVVRLFAQAAAGIAAAHQAGIVHRDVKPANILVSRDGAAVVGDFGLAATAPEHAVAVGTPRYMAPEQRDGGAATERSDQYSLCVALFEALKGEMRAFVPDTRSMRGVPRTLARAIRRGLDPDPDRRHPSMFAFAAALEAASREQRTSRVPRWGLAAGGLIGAAALAVILAWPGSGRWDLPGHWQIARAATSERHGDIAAARASAARAAERARRSGDRGLAADAARLRAHLAPNRTAETATLEAIQTAQLAGRDDLVAEGWLRLALHRTTAGDPAPDVRALAERAGTLAGRAGASELVFEASVARAVFDIAAGRDNSTHAMGWLERYVPAEVWNLRGLAAAMAGDRSTAAAMARRAMAAAVDAPADERAMYMENLAAVTADAFEAVAVLEAALGLIESEHGRHHPALASALIALATVHSRLGHVADATTYALRGLAITWHSFGPSGAESADAMEVLGTVFLDSDEPEPAAAWFEAAATARRAPARPPRQQGPQPSQG